MTTLANGDLLELTENVWSAKLLDAQTATHSGVWVEVPPHVRRLSVVSDSLEAGTTDATVEIHASNGPVKPNDATDGAVINTQTGGIVNFHNDVAWKYIKAKKSAAGTTPAPTTVIARAKR